MVTEQANAHIPDDTTDADGPCDTTKFLKHDSSASSGDVIGALKGIVYASEEFAKGPSLCVDLSSSLINSGTVSTSKFMPGTEDTRSLNDASMLEGQDTIMPNDNPAKDGLYAGQTITEAKDVHGKGVEERITMGGCSSDEGAQKISVGHEVAKECTNPPDKGIEKSTAGNNRSSNDDPQRASPSNKGNFAMLAQPIMYRPCIIHILDNLMCVVVSGFASEIQEIIMPSFSQPPISQVPDVIWRSQERAARFFISDFLGIFCGEDVFPTVEEFLASSDSISHALTSFRALGATWERMSQEIVTVLKQLQAEQSLLTGLDTSDLDSQIDKGTTVVKDLWSLQDALIIEKNAIMMSCDLARARVWRIDARMEQIDEEKERLLSERCAAISEWQECEDNLENIYNIQRESTELIDKSEVHQASLKAQRETKEAERGRLVSAIEGQKCALRKIAEEF